MITVSLLWKLNFHRWQRERGRLCHQPLAELEGRQLSARGSPQAWGQGRDGHRITPATGQISSLIHAGEEDPAGGRRQDKLRLFTDFVTRLLEITNRLQKITHLGAAGDVRWKFN